MKRTLFVFGTTEAAMSAFHEMANTVSGMASAIHRNGNRGRILFGDQQYDFVWCNPDYIMGQTFNEIIFDDLSYTILDDNQKALFRTRTRKGD